MAKRRRTEPVNDKVCSSYTVKVKNADGVVHEAILFSIPVSQLNLEEVPKGRKTQPLAWFSKSPKSKMTFVEAEADGDLQQYLDSEEHEVTIEPGYLGRNVILTQSEHYNAKLTLRRPEEQVATEVKQLEAAEADPDNTSADAAVRNSAQS